MNSCLAYTDNRLGSTPAAALDQAPDWSESTQAFLILITDWLFAWAERARQRRQLGALDGRMLADIGVDRASAQIEVAKPFWQD
ncbi:MAG: DUF1127 domain-containing protein [Alphaproteobacteria bacterium]|nr:DUF1127 domain-containing protein [Alphaproteobacteria bacterium]